MKHIFNRIVASALVALSPAYAMAQTPIPIKASFFVSPVALGSSNDLITRTLSAKTPAAGAIQRVDTDFNLVLETSEFMIKLRGMGVRITGGTSGDAAKLARDTSARNQQVVKNLFMPWNA